VIRQAHTYLAGAVSGTALIAAAIVAFVALVSLQAVRDWPLESFGGGDEAGISNARPASGAAGVAAGGAVRTGARGAARGSRGGRATHPGSHGTALGEAPAPSGGSPNGTPASPGSGAAGGPAPSGSTSTGSGGGGSDDSTSGTLTGAVNKAVSGLDAATGGALGEAGVTQVTEETGNGVVGPESPLGKAVDKATEAVGGLLGG
jgi:hypothetical protein